MRKLGWFAVTAAVAGMIISGVLLLAANLYVQSPGVQQRIQGTLTAALHVPVTLKKTTLTPWEGLRLDGITLRPPVSAAAGSTDGTLLTADSFRLRAAWWPLLTRHRIDIEAILLDHPRLVWAQNTEGRWVWPSDALPPHHQKVPVTSQKAPLFADSFPTPGPSPAASPSPEPSADPGLAPEAGAPPVTQELVVRSAHIKSVAAVQKFRVRHGALDLLNEQRKLLGRFEEVALDGQLSDAGHVKGELRVQRMAHARSGMRLTNFHSGFNYDDATGLSIDHGQGELAGGELQANYRLRTQEAGSPFSAECRVEGVDLSQLIKEAGNQLRLMEGRLQGGFNFQGFSDDPSRRQATGQLKLVGAEVRNFPVLQLLGEMLRIEDLSHLQFKKAELDCRLDGDDMQIAPLTLASNDLKILASGRYSTTEDQLAIHGRLTIDQAISHQLPQFIEMNFTPCENDAPGSRYIDFDVTGPLNKPTTNLFDRVLAGPSNGLLQNLLAPKPKRPRLKGAKADEHSPPQAPASPDGHF